MDSFNKKRTLINEWCKKGFYDQYMNPDGGAVGSQQSSSVLGTSAAVGVGAGAGYLDYRHASKGLGQVNSARQAGGQVSTSFLAKNAPTAFRVGAKTPLIGGALAAGGLAFSQYKMNENQKNFGGANVYKNTNQYKQDALSRNRSAIDLGLIGGGAAIGAAVGGIGGAGIGALPGAALGATIGGVATIGHMGINYGVDKYKQWFQGYNPEQASYADHLATNTSGNAGDYAMALAGRRAGDFMHGGTNNAAHNSELGAAYNAENRI